MLDHRVRSLRPGRPVVLWLVAISMVLSPLVAFAQTSSSKGQGCSDENAIVTDDDGWTRIEAPTFPSEPQEISSYAVDPVVPSTLFVANASSVMRSVDGGCSWTVAFELPLILSPEFPFSSANSVIRSLLIPRVAEAHERVYLLIESFPGAHIVVSDDGGKTWRAADVGALPLGQPLALLAASSAPDTMYLVTAELSRALVFVSHDAGGTWQMATDLSSPSAALPSLPRAVAVDPGEANALWATTQTGLYRSLDGARHWEAVPEAAVRYSGGQRSDQPPDLGALDVHPDSSGGYRPLAFLASEPGALWGREAGQRWSYGTTPGVVTSATHGTSDEEVVIATSNGVYFFDFAAGRRWVAFKNGAPNDPTLLELSSDLARPSSFYGHSRDALWKHKGPLSSLSADDNSSSDPPFTVGFDEQGCDWSPPYLDSPLLDDPASLKPSFTKVVLPAGDSKTVPYRFTVPRLPLDVYFLIDTSGGKMASKLCLARKHLILRSLGAFIDAGFTDVQVGLGEFRDYRGGDYYVGQYVENSESPYVYRRIRDIGPVDQEFVDAVLNLEGAGGGGANLNAVYQAATGGGQHDTGPPNIDIPSGKQANFRPGTLRAIVHVTNTWFNTEERANGTTWGPWSGPDFATTASALRARSINHLGIFIPKHEKEERCETQPGNRDACYGPSYPGAADQRQLSLLAGSLAAKSFDCDNDGVTDVFAGQPLYCQFGTRPYVEDQGTAVPTVPQMVSALPHTLRDATLNVLEGGFVVDKIRPSIYPDIDLATPHELGFKVAYACGPESAGQTHNVELGATLDGEVVATATATVVCTASPPIPPNPIVPIVPALLVVPPPVEPVPNPQPQPGPALGPAPAPAPAPAQAPAQAPAANPQAVAIPQRQVQPQMALVQAAVQVKERLAMQQMMVRVHARGGTPGRALGLGLGALSLLSLYAYASVSLVRARLQKAVRR